MEKITPFLWFDGRAEEAAKFYTSIFKNSKLGKLSHYGPGGPMPAGSIMSVEFQIEGRNYVAFNGGPEFPFTPAISFSVDCASQEEVDAFWEKLLEGGQKNRCGWLQDKFGMSWQIIPSALRGLMSDPDPQKSGRVMKALMQMEKIEIAALQRAYDNK